MKRTIKVAEAGMLLRDYLLEVVSLSNRLVKRLKAHPNGLRINGQHKTVRYVLQVDDVLDICFPPEEVSHMMVGEDLDLSIVYEDDAILVLDKPAGMPTIPSYIHPNKTLANGILGYYKKKQLPYTVHIVTRLDKDTSGLVLVAKHQHSHALLSNEQRKQTLSRKYLAFVEGNMTTDCATIDLPIGRKAGSIIERVVREDGQQARTHYQVLERFDAYSFVEAELETGRTHQIRVHFSTIGHPLVGDDLYGGSIDTFKRQALHCSELSFVHPFTKKDLHFTSNVPNDMRDFHQKYRESI